MNRNEIMEHLGAEEWQWVIDTFAWLNLRQVQAELDEMFASDDNESLAQAIYEELK
jgi:hypothetical protein